MPSATHVYKAVLAVLQTMTKFELSKSFDFYKSLSHVMFGFCNKNEFVDEELDLKRMTQQNVELHLVQQKTTNQ